MTCLAPADRDRLIRDHLGHVERTAHGMWNVPLDVEELIAAGYEALVKAAKLWNPDLSTTDDRSFWAFAHRKVYGAMIDEARRWNHYDRNKKIRPPRNEALHEIEDRDSRHPCASTTFLVELVSQLAQLPERERKVCVLIGLGETERDIAKVFGVSESRVSQIFKRARQRLQAIEDKDS